MYENFKEIKSKIARGRTNVWYPLVAGETRSETRYNARFPFAGECSAVDKVKIDIGLSYNAPISRDWLQRHDDRQVIGIEPDPTNAAKAREMSSDRFVLIEAACDYENEEKEFYHLTSGDSGCCSLFEPTPITGWEYEKIRVKTLKLSDLLEYLLTEYIFIEQIKTDTQGNDDVILMSVEEYLPRIAFYDIEVDPPGQYEITHNSLSSAYIQRFMIEHNFILLERSENNLRFANRSFHGLTHDCGLLT